MRRAAWVSAYRGKLRLLILYLLEGGPKYGYQLMRSMEALAGRSPGAGAVYPQLAYLRSRGLIWSSEPAGSRRRVKLYGLTGEGRAFLDERRDELKELLGFLGGLKELQDMGLADAMEAIWAVARRVNSMSPESKERLRRSIERFLEDLRSLSGPNDGDHD